MVGSIIGNFHRLLVDYWPYVVFLIPLFIIAIPLSEPGSILVGDFPSLINAYYPEKVITTWIDFGSRSNFEFISRLPEIGAGLILEFLGVNSDLISRLMIISGFYLASISFYFCSTKLLNGRAEDKTKLRVAAIVGTIFYAYNPWSFDRVDHYYIWLGYAILPLFFISVIKIFQEPREWKYFFIAVISWTLASSSPHMLVYFGLIFLGIVLFFIVKYILNRKNLIHVGVNVIIVLSFYMLLNSFWAYPFVLSILTGNQKVDTELFKYVVTEEQTENFSRDNSFLNVLRLVNHWSHPKPDSVKEPPETSSLYPIWLTASYLLPALAFLALLSKTFFKRAIVFSLLSVFGILLVMGTNTPFDLYSKLLFETPLLSDLNGLFREPDKLAFLITFGYSMLLSISCFEIIKVVKKVTNRNVLAGLSISLVLGFIIVYSFPMYSWTLGAKFNPVLLPSAFNDLNQYIKALDTDRVLYIPFYDSQRAFWNEKEDQRTPEGMYEFSSAKPNIGSEGLYLLPQYYYRYLESLIAGNGTNDINDVFVPFGTSYIVYHNDVVSPNSSRLLEQLKLLEGLENINNIGFFNIFKTGNNIIEPITIPNLDIGIVGGLNNLDSFISNQTAISFLDQFAQKENEKYHAINGTDYIVLTQNADDLALSFADEEYIIAPADVTNNHNISKLWSKAGVMDPLHGVFHPYLERLGIENWDFDYGKGLVITQARGAKLDIPFNVDTTGSYDIFFRYMENQRGGEVRIFLDNKLIDNIDTKDDISNTFVWKNIIPNISLTEGKHTLTLENAVGFNAVNIFAALPVAETSRLMENADSLANKTRSIYFIEAESAFKSVGKQNVTQIYSLDDQTANRSNQTIAGTLKIPKDVDYLSLNFLAKNNDTEKSNSSYRIDLDMVPIEVFENRSKEPIWAWPNPEATSYYLLEDVEINPAQIGGWINENADTQSISVVNPEGETENKSISQDNGLRIDIKKGNSTNWSFLSTDFIPINDTFHYNYTLDIAAKDVNQLHSKVYYYDSNKTEIKWDFIFEGVDGTFKDTLAKILRTPLNTSYIKLQTWVRPNPEIASYYQLENVEINPAQIGGWINENADTQSISVVNPEGETENKSISQDNGLRIDIKKGNSTNWSFLSTDFIPINENGYYGYNLDISARDVMDHHLKVSFYDEQGDKIRDEIPFGAVNGTFYRNYIDNSVIPPLGTKYLEFSLFVKPNPAKDSHYVINNFKLEDFIHDSFRFENINSTNQKMVADKGSLIVDLKDGDPEQFDIVRTKPIPVRENSLYNYTITLGLRNIADFKVYASTVHTDDVIQKSTKYGNSAGNGNVLVLTPGSEVSTELDILKPANYTLAVRTNSCDTCTPLKLSIEDKEGNSIINNGNTIQRDSDRINNKTSSSELEWLYLNNIYLDSGDYKIKIYSDSQRDLDSVILYSSSNGNNTAKEYETLDDIFSISAPPAYISDYSKVDPTKYTIEISNATSPYILSFAESYDPLWSAYITDNSSGKDTEMSSSIPLYSMTNGFYIDRLGNYSVTVEFRPQQWFIQGGMVSMATIMISLGTYFILQKRRGSSTRK